MLASTEKKALHFVANGFENNEDNIYWLLLLVDVGFSGLYSPLLVDFSNLEVFATSAIEIPGAEIKVDGVVVP